MVNVLDPKRVDPSLAYRRDGHILRGQYESWSTTPFCSTGNRRSGSLVFDFKNPVLALRSKKRLEEGQVPETTVLGIERSGEPFAPHTSERREVILHELELSGAHCFAGNGSASGLFYTDAKATKVYDGPGESRTLQYVREGFKLTVDGKYQISDPWLGLYTKKGRGDFQDLSLGIDETAN